MSTWLSTNPFIGCKVEEDSKPHDDSVYFHITNPIEKQMVKRHENIYYVIDIISSDQTLMDSFDGKEFYTNNIVMPRNYGRIQEFETRVYTTSNYYEKGDVSITPVNTFYIPVKNMESNSFKIDIPKLTYQYISYQRFKNRLVKVVNKNELIWDGVLYKKKEYETTKYYVLRNVYNKSVNCFNFICANLFKQNANFRDCGY